MRDKPGSRIREFLERFGDMLSRIVLALIYFVFVTPVGLIIALARDPLRIRRWSGSAFHPWTASNDTVARARRQIS
jgi:hypothetical protein